MKPLYNYGTVLEAINAFKAEGYNIDFNLSENQICCDQGKYNPSEFEIAKVYRYEGNTDPADEAVVYAIENHNGLKGVLVMGYGASSDAASTEMLAKLKIRE